MNINRNYHNLEESYLFSTIARKVDAYAAQHPDQKVVGTLPCRWCRRWWRRLSALFGR